MRSILIVATLVSGLFFAGCASSQPIDVDLAEQNEVNIMTTNTGTVELLDMLDTAKEASPEADWTKEWSLGRRISHELQMEANTEVASKVTERAKKYNEKK